MIKSVLAAGTALVLSMGAAHAATIQIDNFVAPSAQVMDNTADGVADTETDTNYVLNGNTFTRTLSVNQTYNENDSLFVESSASIAEGRLRINNDTEANSVVELSYNIDDIVDNFSGSSELALDLLFNDLGVDEEGNPIELLVELFLGGDEVGEYVIQDQGILDQMLTFDLPALQLGEMLMLRISGGISFDSTFGPLSLQVRDGGGTGGEVPEPAALGLLGLGLAGVAVARRRKARA